MHDWKKNSISNTNFHSYQLFLFVIFLTTDGCEFSYFPAIISFLLCII